ncbi:HNH endonuclease [Aeromonas media]|uniref:HNH endonuclease n=1 Tax=Aeromonas media TaxID=651 RepID=UPI002B462C76|nr:HNH endonuclease [Aeromonas media]
MIDSSTLNLSISEKSIIQRLLAYINPPNNYRVTDVWSCFSSPAETKNVKSPQGSIVLNFTKDEILNIKSTKKKLTGFLSKQSKKRCAYCKRPIGNYGWSWQIEHIKCKSHNKDLTFKLNNLTLACIDCNYRKASSIDRKNRSELIINPNDDDFEYNQHLGMELNATEDFILLSYEKRSDLGTSTYTNLKLNNLEFSSTLRSIDENLDFLIDNIDSILTSPPQNDNERHLIALLGELKENILSQQN